jgi:hypothetical protein
MRVTWILPTCTAVLAALPAAGGFAQDQQQYETPLYTTQTPSALDKNYGLPTFGMQGAELPQQKATAPEAAVPADPDFFKRAPEVALPKAQTSTAMQTGSEPETPLYTTPEGSTTGDTTSLSGDTMSSTGDTMSSDSGVTR